MRRLLGCFSTLILIGVAFLILVVRGPGLKSLLASTSLEPLINAPAQGLEASDEPVPRQPSLAQATPITQLPTTVRRSPTVTSSPPAPTAESSDVAMVVDVLSPAGKALDAVIDGNTIMLAAHASNPTQAAIAGTVSFYLAPPNSDSVPIASCPIDIEPDGQASCTERAAADGWAWQDAPLAGIDTPQRMERRTVYAILTGRKVPQSDSAPPRAGCCEPVRTIATVEIPVRPKPVVLVHGFTSSAATWSAWIGRDGFLARWGMAGYAVGDARLDIEPMDTGIFTQPRRPTKSIAENAEIVARYIDAVQKATGAQRVDLVAHSMGGLISRYYVSHFMPMVKRQGLPPVPAVNQLYMIGTPNAGTPCAIPLATLGLYPPATTQLTPAYVQYLFNPQTHDPQGVPFLVLAGDPVHDFAALVCTLVPTDVFVSVASAAGAIPVTAETMPVRHSEQTSSPAVFATVLQSLARGPSEYPIPMATGPAIAPTNVADLQVSVVDSGTLSPDRVTTVSVTVDEAETASFLLYAPGQDVNLSILSNVGRRITADTAASAPDVAVATADGHGVTATQGFRIKKPKAGRWQLILTPRAGAQTDRAFYAVAAFLQSNLRLAVETPSPFITANQPIPIHATLSGSVALETVTATATVRDAHGNVAGKVALFDDGVHDDGKAGDGVFGDTWIPMEAGLYSVTVTASGQNMAGAPFQRLGLLAVEVQ